MIEVFVGATLIVGLFTAVTVTGAHFIGWKAMAGAWVFTVAVVAVTFAATYLIERGLAG